MMDDATGRQAEWPVFSQLTMPFVTLHEDAANRAVGDVYFDEQAFSRWSSALCTDAAGRCPRRNW